MRNTKQWKSIGTRRGLRLWAIVGLLSVVSAAPAAAASIASFDSTLSTLQAGGHPDFTVTIAFRTTAGTVPDSPCFDASFNPAPCQVVEGGAAKDIVTDMPRGLVGNPQAAEACTIDELTNSVCPTQSQVGIVEVSLIVGGSPDILVPPAPGTLLPLFNMVPERGELAKLGMNVAGINTFISIKVRSGSDYGLTATVGNIDTTLPLWKTGLTIWGVPGDPIHDAQRACDASSGGNNLFGCHYASFPRPFLSNGAECGTPQQVGVAVDTYQQPGSFVTGAAALPPLTGCEHQAFNPTISVTPTSTERGAPTGLDVDLEVPQTYDDPNGLATPALRDAKVMLPGGMSISPGSADGLQACGDDDLGLGRPEPARCPLASKIGSVELQTPVLADHLSGAIYLRPQASRDPLSGDLIRIALEMQSAARGLVVKVPGQISLDPSTGRVTTRFQDAPELPFSSLRLHFKAGSRAPLTLPVACGVASVTSELSGWGMASASTIETTFRVTHDGALAPCGRDFAPSFVAGATSVSAGADTGFALTVSRTDDDQELEDVGVRLPPGLLGRIASVEQCSDSAAATGACPERARVGTAMTAAGAGGNPLWISGRVYLTGPYRGAPFGLAIVVPAVAGPFDLGTVVVRAAIEVDRRTAALRIASDPLPTILSGIPLRLKTIDIHVDRTGFMVNPTNCAPMRVEGVIGSTDGARVARDSRFQVGECQALPYRPRLSIRVGGRGHTRPGVATPLVVTLRSSRGQANSRAVTVALPSILNARLPVINNACTLAELRAGQCGRARIGSATAVTPVLNGPLRGSVYLVKSPARAIPDLVVALHGAVDIDLTGKVSIPGGKALKTSFATIPDVPIDRFTLRLSGGRNGPVGLAGDLCRVHRARARATVGLRGQNGKTLRVRQKVRIAGCARRR